jgi:hypothetical protein
MPLPVGGLTNVDGSFPLALFAISIYYQKILFYHNFLQKKVLKLWTGFEGIKNR